MASRSLSPCVHFRRNSQGCEQRAPACTWWSSRPTSRRSAHCRWSGAWGTWKYLSDEEKERFRKKLLAAYPAEPPPPTSEEKKQEFSFHVCLRKPFGNDKNTFQACQLGVSCEEECPFIAKVYNEYTEPKYHKALLSAETELGSSRIVSRFRDEQGNNVVVMEKPRMALPSPGPRLGETPSVDNLLDRISQGEQSPALTSAILNYMEQQPSFVPTNREALEKWQVAPSLSAYLKARLAFMRDKQLSMPK